MRDLRRELRWSLGPALLLAAACAHAPPASSRGEEGEASFYASSLAGRPTASGVPYDPEALTCAHRTAPFGQRLRVTNLVNGRSVIVAVTDRGPFVSGRVVDLSMSAARELGMVERGHVPVRLEPVR
jgi:rare lipoprotein A